MEVVMDALVNEQADFLRWFYGGTPPADDNKDIDAVQVLGVCAEGALASGVVHWSRPPCSACLDRDNACCTG
jgi:hypothetical protein